MQAREIMTGQVIAVSPRDTVQQLARVLTEAGISGAPVRDEAGRLLGIVSEADVISKRGAHVEDVMQRSVLTVAEDTPVEEVCYMMSCNNINRVPVMNGEALVGIITRTDVVRAMAQGRIGRTGGDVGAGFEAQSSGAVTVNQPSGA
ncbi:MAG: CBS domain-containing protein [Chloroflexota bacterium]|nr:CBS domain-containing protein [Chloroflexota bacterium]